MSDIRKGDLVMVVRGHDCILQRVAGIPFVVTDFQAPQGGGWTCGFCGMRDVAPNVAGAYGIRPKRKTKKGGYTVIPVVWLKRLPPIEELDRNQIVEDLTCER